MNRNGLFLAPLEPGERTLDEGIRAKCAVWLGGELRGILQLSDESYWWLVTGPPEQRFEQHLGPALSPDILRSALAWAREREGGEAA